MKRQLSPSCDATPTFPLLSLELLPYLHGEAVVQFPLSFFSLGLYLLCFPSIFLFSPDIPYTPLSSQNEKNAVFP